MVGFLSLFLFLPWHMDKWVWAVLKSAFSPTVLQTYAVCPAAFCKLWLDVELCVADNGLVNHDVQILQCLKNPQRVNKV